MKVCVQGLWHLGTVTAACLASAGHRVTGFDTDAGVIAKLMAGTPPLFEPGLEELIKKGLASGQLAFSDKPQTALKDIEVLWVAYDTPVDEDDNADVAYVIREIEKVLPHVPAGTTMVISSQMPIGSIRRLEAIARERYTGKAFGFACSPENLRLGKALDVFLKPDRIIVGVRTGRDRARLELLLRPITERIEWMSVESAEMTKHAINAFLAASVTFANEIASICEQVGADAKEVERGLKTENRIGPRAYLSPGGAFAGGTLARDIAFLNQAAAGNQLVTPLLSSIKVSNAQHKQWAARKLRELFPELSRTTVAVWGLTYKAGTDTLRRSMAVELCDWLLGQGVSLRVHDPVVRELPPAWAGKVERTDDPLLALARAQALIISTEWPLYKDIPAAAVAGAAPGLAVLDANRFLPALAAEARVRYFAVGTPKSI
jgi:UDPglucose 6-dehydrogenase